MNCKKNILVTGSNGQVGQEIRYIVDNTKNRYESSILESKKAILHPFISKHNFYFMPKNKLDITKKRDLQEFVEQNDIETIINCAAYTSVDKAEDDYQSADLVNHIAVRNLAEIAKKREIKLIHISTDYVYDGKKCKPYVEDDPVFPLSVYGKTKLDGEKEIVKINPKSFIIIRTSWVYGCFGNNFVKTIIKLAKEKKHLDIIYDQIGTPTYAGDLAMTILMMLEKNRKDYTTLPVYHYSNEGVCSWYDFAQAIISKAKLDCQINPIRTKDYPALAIRPNYSLLDKTKIKSDFDIKIPYWKDSLDKMIDRMKNA